MATLTYNAEKLSLLIPTAVRHTQFKFRRDNISVRPSNLDHIVEAIYTDIEAINSSLGAAVSFSSLIDTPANYTGKANYLIGVNDTEDGVEYKEWIVQNASNEMYPNTAGTGLGKASNGIGKIYFDSTGNLDYQGDLEILTAGTQKAVFKGTSGYLGVGVTNPLEPLHSSDGIVIGSAAQSSAGTIQWTGTDFEGYNGSSWVSLVGGLNFASADLTVSANRSHALNNFSMTFTDAGGSTAWDLTTGSAGHTLTHNGATGGASYGWAWSGWGMSGGGASGNFVATMGQTAAQFTVDTTPSGGWGGVGFVLNNVGMQTSGFVSFNSHETTFDSVLSADQSYYLYSVAGLMKGRYRATGGGLSDVTWDISGSLITGSALTWDGNNKYDLGGALTACRYHWCFRNTRRKTWYNRR